jgi:ABC-type glycerol-3-phosphate transport system permease component
MELAYVRVQWRALMLAILNLQVLLPEDVSLIGYLLVLQLQVLPADAVN